MRIQTIGSPAVTARNQIITPVNAARLLPRELEGEMDPGFPQVGTMSSPEFIVRVFKSFWAMDRGVRKRLVGQEQMRYWSVRAFFATGERQPKHLGKGHIIFVGHPGSGKTVLAESLKELFNMTTSRIQGGPDTMFADIVGNFIRHIDESGRSSLRFAKGAIFADYVSADEITRLLERVQSAFLEVMSEGQVTDTSGVKHPCGAFIAGTSNDAHVNELVDALHDRFALSVRVQLPTAEQNKQILDITDDYPKVHIEPIGTIDDVNQLREFFKEHVRISSELREFMGTFARLIDTIDATALLSDLRGELQLTEHDEFVKPGSVPLSGRSLPVWEGIARAHAAAEYRDHVNRNDLWKTIMPVVRHRMHYTPNIISQDSRERVQDKLRRRFQGTGKAEMSEYVTQEIVKKVWENVEYYKE